MRRVLALLAVAIIPLACATTRPVVKATTRGSASYYVQATNVARAQHGLRPLTVASDLAANAAQHSAQMAARGTIWDDANLGSEVCCWQLLGENTGEGSDDQSIEAALMASSPHRANILDPSFTQIGVFTAVKNGVVYVTEVFREPRQPAVSVASKPSPVPTPRPRPRATTPAPTSCTG